MTDDKEVKRKIDWAQNILNKSIERLFILKTGNGDIKDALLGFQPELADCLFETMMFYRMIKDEERETINRKLDLDLAVFRQRMAKLHKY